MHRFLSPAADEAFADVTPEQVRVDLAELDAVLPLEPSHWPTWVERLEVALDCKVRWQEIVAYGLRYLADRAAADRSIVEALAAADSCVYEDGDGDEYHRCLFCDATLPSSLEAHEPDCVWRRAVEATEADQ